MPLSRLDSGGMVGCLFWSGIVCFTLSDGLAAVGTGTGGMAKTVRKFENIVVVLDDRGEYSACNFEDIVVVWKGRGEYREKHGIKNKMCGNDGQATTVRSCFSMVLGRG